jgi:hypothetical protein
MRACVRACVSLPPARSHAHTDLLDDPTPPRPWRFLLAGDVPAHAAALLTTVCQSEGGVPVLDPVRHPTGTLAPSLARQQGLAWSLLWTVANVRAGGDVPVGAGSGRHAGRGPGKTNHIPTSYHLTHKARLVTHLADRHHIGRSGSRAGDPSRCAGGPTENDADSVDGVLPPSWLLPLPMAVLGRLVGRAQPPLVLKPTHASRGVGVLVAGHDAAALAAYNRDGYMLQRYVEPPDLLPLAPGRPGHKYHVRLYVLVTALAPPRAYVHALGYAKLAVCPYTDAGAASPEADVHVTNYQPGHVYAADPYWPLADVHAAWAARYVSVSMCACIYVCMYVSACAFLCVF